MTDRARDSSHGAALRRGVRRLLCAAALVGALGASTVGCSEEPSSEIQPIQFSGREPRPEPPAEVVVSPHLRRRELTDSERVERDRMLAAAGSGGAAGAAGGVGGGGGGGRPQFGDNPEDWRPHPEPEPSAREVEAFRRDLERELAARVDPTEDACDQYRDRLAATMAAQRRPGDPEVDVPSREEMRRLCNGMGPGYARCLDQDYFREHLDECQTEIDRGARRGERISNRARRRWAEIDEGRRPVTGADDGEEAGGDEPSEPLEIVDQEMIGDP